MSTTKIVSEGPRRIYRKCMRCKGIGRLCYDGLCRDCSDWMTEEEVAYNERRKVLSDADDDSLPAVADDPPAESEVKE